MKDNKLRSKDFFDAKDDPYITFHSTKIEQTGPESFDVPRAPLQSGESLNPRS